MGKFLRGPLVKKLALIMAILSIQTALACKQESQFVASIGKTVFKDGACHLSVNSFSHYAVSQLCPLFDVEVLEEGFIWETTQSFCEQSQDSTLSGYLVRLTPGSNIFFD